MANREVGRSAPSDAGLNLLWPGLAQYSQGRWLAATWFSGEAMLAATAFVFWSSGRTFALVALAAVTVWSIVDARMAEQ